MVPGLVLALFLSNPQTPAPTTTESQPSAPCENPDKDGKYHVRCGVKAPEVIYKVEPEFSEEARKKKVTAAICTIGLTVDIDGRPTNIHIVHSAAEELNKKKQKAGLSLDQKAMEAVAQYKFTPAAFKGRPVPVHIKIEINFQIF
jgi:protein TonB